MLYLFYRAKTGCTVVKHEAGTGALQLDWAVDAGSTCLVVASNAIRDHLRSKGCQATMLTVPEAGLATGEQCMMSRKAMARIG